MHTGERFNTSTHLVGLVLAIAGLPLLLAKALPSGEATKIASALVFALSCLVLYAASSLYHGSSGAAKLRWERADHCAIYVLVAGSLTPFALVNLKGLASWAVLSAVWGIAALGVFFEARSAAARPPLALFIGFGWAAVLAAAPLAAHLDAESLCWLLAGAACYTVGTFFYLNPRNYRHSHGLWHLFVVGGTACHYSAVTLVVT